VRRAAARGTGGKYSIAAAPKVNRLPCGAARVHNPAVASSPQGTPQGAPALDAATALRIARILHIAFLVAIATFVIVGEAAGPPEPRDLGPIYTILAALAVAMLIPAAIVRQKLVRSAEEHLRLRPEEMQLVGRWLAGNIVSFALCEAVAIYGLVLRLLGGTLPIAAPFYAAAAIFLFFFTPRLDAASKPRPF
jgi:F0F1-type ATP synthase membrane subunit c/vacuolar-type H+-ATPase subunit K